MAIMNGAMNTPVFTCRLPRSLQNGIRHAALHSGITVGSIVALAWSHSSVPVGRGGAVPARRNGGADNSVFTCRLAEDLQTQIRLHAQVMGRSVASLLSEIVQNYLLATEGGGDESPVTSVHTHARTDLPDLFVIEDLDAA
jgi:hypothetical protein